MIISDFHVHSRFAMACSKYITITSLGETAQTKGINLIGTGDILHKDWLAEAEKYLEEIGSTGLFRLKNSSIKTKFILSSEVSTIFTDNGKVRKIHNCLLLPNIDSAKNLRDRLSKYGSMDSDGRPILSTSAANFVEELFSTEKNAFVFPAHIWTPYFGALGSISGFDSIKDAYKEQEKHIHAIETGLSSDPPMNWLISELDKYSLISNSDMHSLMNMGREANVLNIELENATYKSVIESIKNKSEKRLNSTIEFYPEEGKYHYDGHRDCHFSADPISQNIKACRICGKPLVRGVLNRVMALSDRPIGYTPKAHIPYTHIVPLMEIIAYSLKRGKYTKTVKEMYDSLIKEFTTEFSILIDVNTDAIAQISNKEIADSIINMRNENIKIKPGYAGVFGSVDLLPDRYTGTATNQSQKGLSDF